MSTRKRRAPVKFADEQITLMGIDRNGNKTPYHGWKDTYIRKEIQEEVIFNFNEITSRKASGYMLDGFVVDDDNVVFNNVADYGSGYYSDEEEYKNIVSEESNDSDDSDEEEEFEDSDEEEEFEESDEEIDNEIY